MKKNLSLVIILLALVAVYFFVVQEKTPVVSIDRPLVEADSASITKLVIHSAENDVELIKQGDGWMVNGTKPYPANERTLGTALKRFSEMSKKALISEQSDRFSDFEVGDSAGVKVTVQAGGKSTTLILGKAGPTFQTSYVRLAGSDEIWEISGNHRGTFDRKSVDWRDKTINQYENADFTKLELIYPDQSFTVGKQDTVWHLKSAKMEFDADTRLVERLTRMLSRMNTVEFADTLGEDIFANPSFQLLAELTTGETVDIKLVSKDEEKFYLRKAGAMSDFVIYKSTANALMKMPTDFRPEVKQDDASK
jgi:hypothetical protein